MKSPFLTLLLATVAATAVAATAVAADAPAAEPKSPGAFDISALDRAVDPCVDFYQFACGGWRKANPIPPDQTRWGRFNELAERNREELHQILEAAKDPAAKRSPIEARVGDYYAACMDEATIEARGRKPLEPDPGAGRGGPVEGRLLPPPRRERGECPPHALPLRLGAGPPRLEHRRSPASARAASACPTATTT